MAVRGSSTKSELSPLQQARLLCVLEDQVTRRVGGVARRAGGCAHHSRIEPGLGTSGKGEYVWPRFVLPSGYYLDLPPSAACRKEGILPPLEYVIDRYNPKFRKPVQGITKESRTLMMKYDWPGNVRELKNAVERAMILEESTSSPGLPALRCRAAASCLYGF
jgi:two-component system response regulator AtoC